VKGSGYVLVGLALFFLALIMLLRSRMNLPKIQQPVKEKKMRSEDYR